MNRFTVILIVSAGALVLVGCKEQPPTKPATSTSQPTTSQAAIDDDADLFAPPDPAAVEVNKARLASLAEMRARGITPADAPKLIELLAVAVEEPAQETNAPRLAEGYAQAEAQKELISLGAQAHGELLAALKTANPPIRSSVFAILMQQGVKQAIDDVLAMPHAGGLEGEVGYYLGWFDPDESNANGDANLQSLRDWYAKNRSRLKYNAQTGRFETPVSATKYKDAPALVNQSTSQPVN